MRIIVLLYFYEFTEQTYIIQDRTGACTGTGLAVSI